MEEGTRTRKRGGGRFWSWLLPTVGLSLVLGLFRLGEWPSTGTFRDVAINGIDALRVLAGQGPQLFFAANGGREGPFIDLVALSFKAFGVGGWQLRLPSVVFIALAVLLAGILGRRLLGRRAGLAAAFLMATSPGIVMLSRTGLRASTIPAISALAILAFLWALDRERPAAWAWGLAGLASAAGFYAYLSWAVVPLGLGITGLVLLLRRDRRVSLASAASWFLALVTAALPPLLARQAVMSAGGLNRVADVGSNLLLGNPVLLFVQAFLKEAGSFVWLGDASWVRNVAPLPRLLPLGALMLLAGFAWCLRGERRMWLLLPLTFMLGLLPAALGGPWALPHILRGTAALLPAFLMAGLGYEAAADYIERKQPALSRVLPALVLAGALVLVPISVLLARSDAAAVALDYDAAEWQAGLTARAGGSDLVMAPSGRQDDYAAVFVLAAWPKPVTVIRTLAEIAPGQRVFCDRYVYQFLKDGDSAALGGQQGTAELLRDFTWDAQGYLQRNTATP